MVNVRRRIVRATNVFFEGEIGNERKTNPNMVFDLDILIYYIIIVIRFPPDSVFRADGAPSGRYQSVIRPGANIIAIMIIIIIINNYYYDYCQYFSL